MRHIITTAALATGLSLAASPALATTPDDPNAIDNPVDDNDNDDGFDDWGLLGLFGLAGLAGLTGARRRGPAPVGRSTDYTGTGGVDTVRSAGSTDPDRAPGSIEREGF